MHHFIHSIKSNLHSGHSSLPAAVTHSSDNNHMKRERGTKLSVCCSGMLSHYTKHCPRRDPFN